MARGTRPDCKPAVFWQGKRPRQCFDPRAREGRDASQAVTVLDQRGFGPRAREGRDADGFKIPNSGAVVPGRALPVDDEGRITGSKAKQAVVVGKTAKEIIETAAALRIAGARTARLQHVWQGIA